MKSSAQNSVSGDQQRSHRIPGDGEKYLDLKVKINNADSKNLATATAIGHINYPLRTRYSGG